MEIAKTKQVQENVGIPFAIKAVNKEIYLLKGKKIKNVQYWIKGAGFLDENGKFPQTKEQNRIQYILEKEAIKRHIEIESREQTNEKIIAENEHEIQRQNRCKDQLIAQEATNQKSQNVAAADDCCEGKSKEESSDQIYTPGFSWMQVKKIGSDLESDGELQTKNVTPSSQQMAKSEIENQGDISGNYQSLVPPRQMQNTQTGGSAKEQENSGLLARSDNSSENKGDEIVAKAAEEKELRVKPKVTQEDRNRAIQEKIRRTKQKNREEIQSKIKLKEHSFDRFLQKKSERKSGMNQNQTKGDLPEEPRQKATIEDEGGRELDKQTIEALASETAQIFQGISAVKEPLKSRAKSFLDSGVEIVNGASIEKVHLANDQLDEAYKNRRKNGIEGPIQVGESEISVLTQKVRLDQEESHLNCMSETVTPEFGNEVGAKESMEQPQRLDSAAEVCNQSAMPSEALDSKREESEPEQCQATGKHSPESKVSKIKIVLPSRRTKTKPISKTNFRALADNENQDLSSESSDSLVVPKLQDSGPGPELIKSEEVMGEGDLGDEDSLLNEPRNCSYQMDSGEAKRLPMTHQPQTTQQLTGDKRAVQGCEYENKRGPSQDPMHEKLSEKAIPVLATDPVQKIKLQESQYGDQEEIDDLSVVSDSIRELSICGQQLLNPSEEELAPHQTTLIKEENRQLSGTSVKRDFQRGIYTTQPPIEALEFEKRLRQKRPKINYNENSESFDSEGALLSGQCSSLFGRSNSSIASSQRVSFERQLFFRMKSQNKWDESEIPKPQYSPVIHECSNQKCEEKFECSCRKHAPFKQYRQLVNHMVKVHSACRDQIPSKQELHHMHKKKIRERKRQKQTEANSGFKEIKKGKFIVKKALVREKGSHLSQNNGTTLCQESLKLHKKSDSESLSIPKMPDVDKNFRSDIGEGKTRQTVEPQKEPTNNTDEAKPKPNGKEQTDIKKYLKAPGQNNQLQGPSKQAPVRPSSYKQSNLLQFLSKGKKGTKGSNR